jgi:hypothetical protein
MGFLSALTVNDTMAIVGTLIVSPLQSRCCYHSMIF